MTPTTANFSCPAGYVVPNALVSNPPSFNSTATLTASKTVTNAILIRQGDLSGDATTYYTEATADFTIAVTVTQLLKNDTDAEVLCVKNADANSFS